MPHGVKQCATCDDFNYLLNHPAIRPHIGPPTVGPVDGTDLFYDFFNVIYGDRRGGAVFIWNAPGVFEGHYLFPPELRGRAALHQSRLWLSDMFTSHDAKAIFGLVPRENRASQVMTRALGFSKVGTTTLDRYGQECFKYVMTEEVTHGWFDRRQREP